MTGFEVRAILLAELEAARCRLAGVELPGINGSGDAADHSIHEERRDLAFGARARQLAKVEQIGWALERLDAGTYGRAQRDDRVATPSYS